MLPETHWNYPNRLEQTIISKSSVIVGEILPNIILVAFYERKKRKEYPRNSSVTIQSLHESKM
jgi:hypothetical protein